MRLSVAVAVSCLSMVALSTAEEADAAIKKYTSIEAQALRPALQQLATERDVQFVYRSELVGDRRTRGATGDLTFDEALTQLLSGTGLTFQYLDEKAITLVPLRPSVSPDQKTRSPERTDIAKSSAASIGGGGVSAGDEDGNIWSRFRLAQAETTTADSRSGEQSPNASDTKPAIEEIIVTAQKRTERLQDVPVPVSVVSADSLAERNQVLLRDYFTSVPGLDVMPSIQSQQTLSIRGVSTGTGNPTVAVTIDDVPYGSSTNIGGGRAVPDIDPGDLARVEVLRGPQGTLYGASSLGGLLKFVTRDPSADAVSGNVQVGTASLSESDDLGYSVRGSINVPLGATAAIRASAFTRQDAGFVDNVQSGEEDVNSAEAAGGRLSALWRASDAFSLKLSALLQETDGDGATSSDPALGDLLQSRVRNSGWFERHAEAYSAIATITVGDAEVVSLTGYNVNGYDDSLDLSFLIGGQAQSNFGVPGATLVSANETEKVSQEFRVSSSLGEKFDWTLAGFYSNEDSDLLDSRWAIDPANGAVVGRLFHSLLVSSFQEYAGSVNLTYHVIDTFDIQLGGRQSEIEQTFEQTTTTVTGAVSIVPEINRKTDAFTYLVTPRWKVSDDVMVYARFASGYRAGGINPFPSSLVPAVYEPDSTENYEIGLKGNYFDNALTIDASVYHIDWQDIQLLLISPAAFSYSINGSEARTQGVELSFDLRPARGLTASGWVAWNNSELTEPLPPGAPGTAVGAAGERLPNSSRISGSLSLDHTFPITNSLNGFVGGSVIHMGDRVGPFRAVPIRQEFDSYNRVDLRVGLGADTWNLSAFVNNVGDERGEIYGGLGANPPTAFAYIQPRTVGLTVTKSF